MNVLFALLNFFPLLKINIMLLRLFVDEAEPELLKLSYSFKIVFSTLSRKSKVAP